MDSGSKVFAYGDVIRNKERSKCWLLISGKVYDVSSFLEEHPGGDEVLLASSGKDSTEDFEDVGHSDDAKSMMEKYYIGEIDSSTVPTSRKFKAPVSSASAHKPDEPGFLLKILQFLVPLLILGVAFGLKSWGKKDSTED